YRNYRIFFIYFIVTLVTFIIALLIGIFKPEQKINQIACLGLFAQTVIVLSIALFPIADFLHGAARILYFAGFFIYPFHFVLGYIFYYNFPARIERGRLASTFKNLLYIVGTILFLGSRWVDLIILQGEEHAIDIFYRHGQMLAALWQARYIYELI